MTWGEAAAAPEPVKDEARAAVARNAGLTRRLLDGGQEGV
jgi:hypothetical protein